MQRTAACAARDSRAAVPAMARISKPFAAPDHAIAPQIDGVDEITGCSFPQPINLSRRFFGKAEPLVNHTRDTGNQKNHILPTRG
jgi:hypothetical protein